MKKILLIAASAALVLASCAKIEHFQAPTAGDDASISFGVYAGRTTNTKATYGDITTANLSSSQDGFGVFAYYTQTTDWASAAASATPNFMYNQQVRNISSYAESPSDYTAAKYPSGWYYTPIKYWPNGQNSTAYEAAATSADKISFFAYAPQIATVNTVPATGQGITAMSANTANGAPTLNFTVPTKAEEQIDLLWANPVLNATKQALSGRVAFTFKHALSKLNIQVRAVVDDLTGATSNLPTDNGDDTVDQGETWIILESLTLTANGTKSGTLTLDGAASAPSWTSVSGNTAIEYGEDSFTATAVKTANSKTGFKVTETATDLNSTKSPMIIPATITAGGFIITANYWVITKDSALNGGFSTIQNNITKTSAAAVTFDAGKKYNIIVNLGLNSVDFNVTEVTDWAVDSSTEYHLPQNNS
ncbi:MAG: fimbrillin family protein [Bacteroidales bacterium]|nr:fimbrillin family protein [Bacteroidales bacterium]